MTRHPDRYHPRSPRYRPEPANGLDERRGTRRPPAREPGPDDEQDPDEYQYDPWREARR